MLVLYDVHRSSSSFPRPQGKDSTLKRRRLSALFASAGLLAGCASTGSTSSFRGVLFPVLLGPKDRVNMTAPAPATKVDNWYAEAVNFASSQDTQTTRTITETREATSFMAETAVAYFGSEHKGDANLEMRVTRVEGSAYVTAFGGAAKEFVRVETDIVRPGAAK
jgi:hypothetical protein